MRKGYYIVLTHSYHAMKDKPGKHEVNEKCEFVSDIKNRHLTSATVILDAVNRTFVKSRVKDASYDQFIAHIEKTHPEYQEFKNYLIEQGVIEKPFANKEVKVDDEGTVELAD